MADKKASFSRLPTDVVPKKYVLNYSKIDLVNFTFDGTVTINAEVQKPTSSITLNALEIWIKVCE